MKIFLNGPDWSFKGFIGEDWLWRKSHMPGTRDHRGWAPACVPGSVVNDLWQCNEIPNPYFERNSLLIEWAPARTWLYRKTFTLGQEHQGKRIRLHFEGVDYEARFYLNGELLGQHRGMYTPVVFETGHLLKYDQENLLAVVIEPAPLEQPQVGYTSRVRTHKSRMTYWWDFCPRMVHQGIWDRVWLEISGQTTLEDVFARPTLQDDFSAADIEVAVRVSPGDRETVTVESDLLYDGEAVPGCSARQALAPGQDHIHFIFKVEAPHLWWPDGEGEQHLYQAEVRLLVLNPDTPDESDVSGSRTVTFGIRRIEFAANETSDTSARPYTLVANGRKIYIKGWNWVPMDVLYGVERPAKLRRLLNLAKRAHVNMLRVWGGGLIEKEAFYDLCDRLGILVWQEFIQSSSGIDNNAPEAPEFIEMMVSEARQIVVRKRNHASLAIWCGGNELQSGNETPLDDDHPMLAALKQVVNELDPDRFWLPTSPSGKVFGNSIENILRDPASLHDVHGPWEHQGLERHHDLYNRGTSLLHSEFGVEGITNPRTLNRTIAPEHQWPISLDNPVWMHLGAWWVKAASWQAIFGELPDVETTVKALQLLQASGLAYAVEADRRRQYQNSGTLPWQFNEPYPMAACTSAVDYYAQPKPAYYAVARVYEPVHLSAKFPVQAWAGRERFECEVWVSSSLEQACETARLEQAVIGLSGKRYTQSQQPVRVGSNGSYRLGSMEWDLSDLEEDVFFLDLILAGAGGELLAQDRTIFTRTTNLSPLLAAPGTQLEVHQSAETGPRRLTLTNRGEATALFVWLEDCQAETGSVYFSDNYFCLFPGETRLIDVTWDEDSRAPECIEVRGWNFPKEQLWI